MTNNVKRMCRRLKGHTITNNATGEFIHVDGFRRGKDWGVYLYDTTRRTSFVFHGTTIEMLVHGTHKYFTVTPAVGTSTTKRARRVKRTAPPSTRTMARV